MMLSADQLLQSESQESTLLAVINYCQNNLNIEVTPNDISAVHLLPKGKYDRVSLVLYDSATAVFVTRSLLHVVECGHHVQNLHRLYTSTSICRRPMNSYSPSVDCTRTNKSLVSGHGMVQYVLNVTIPEL